MRFKRGDKVTYIGSGNSNNYGWKDFIGQHGVVLDCDSAYSVVVFNTLCPNGSDRATINNSNIKLRKIYKSHPYTNIFKDEKDI